MPVRKTGHVPQIPMIVPGSWEELNKYLVLRQAFEGPEDRASLPEIKQDVRRQHVSRVLKARLDQASSYEEFSFSREKELFEQRQGGHRGTDRMSGSLWLEHRVRERTPCKLNCQGRLRLNTRGPP